MKPQNYANSRVALVTVALLAVIGLPISMPGQDAAARMTGLPQDWTHHHLVFSNPGTEQEAFVNGTHDEWLKTVTNPRYTIQQLHRGLPAQGLPGGQRTTALLNTANAREAKSDAVEPGKKKDLKKDWNASLGSTTAPNYATYPAKWSFGTTSASCANDFVIYPTGQAGSASHASIIAYYNLYVSGCTGTVPQTDWAYNTGGTVSLSPQFSIGGSQAAFVQTSGTAASLVLLTFPLIPPGTGTLSGPVSPTAKTPSTYQNCTAPCMTTIAFSGTTPPNDTLSSPYYDYLNDSLYAGTSDGKLHKFHPVFSGIPGEVVTTGWPVTLNASNTPTSPVYDATSGCVFVGDTGGILYSVQSGSAGTVCTNTSGSVHGTSSRLDATYGIRDAPLVDSTAGRVYVFAGNDPSGNNGVFQFPTSFTTGSGTEAIVTSGSNATGATAYQLAGTFDNTYYTSSSPSSPSGYLYVCGTGAPATLYQIAISSNTMGTVTTGPTLADSGFYGRCSPVTEFFNASVPTTATGTVTLSSNPNVWSTGTTLTIGSTKYTFVSSLTAVNQVLLHTSGNSNTNETDTAENLEAVINNTSSQCNGGSSCIFSGQTANASVTATQNAHIVTLTAKTAGSGGDFTLSTNQTSEIAVSGGNNGLNGKDFIFLSVYIGTQTGCTDSVNNGCVMSFDVTTPSNFSSSLTPGGTLNLSAPTSSSPTGGVIIDNALSNPAGTSQIYFLTLDTGGTSPCTGICAVQDSQSAP